MMEAHLTEEENILSSITIANKHHVSMQLLTLPKPGILCALPRLHKHKHLITTKYSHSHLKKTLMNTEQVIPAAISLKIRPPYRQIISRKGT